MFSVSIHKPVTSRPANSERYLVCMWKKIGTESAEQHLFSVNSILWNGLKGDDVTELVPLGVIQEDKGFFEYIYKSNCMYVFMLYYISLILFDTLHVIYLNLVYRLGEKQIKHLLKIASFSKDKNLKEENQAEMREQCLKLWQVRIKNLTALFCIQYFVFIIDCYVL